MKISDVHIKLESVGIPTRWLIRMDDRKLMFEWINLKIDENILNTAISKAIDNTSRFGVKYLDPIIKQLIHLRDNPESVPKKKTNCHQSHKDYVHVERKRADKKSSQKHRDELKKMGFLK